MTTAYVTQNRVERAARDIVAGAAETLDLASPWVEPYPIQRLLGEALPRVRAGELAVRLVYRVAEESDLRITDLSALEALAAEGVQMRYSRRLHAKLVIADRERALVGSSNLTRRGGYGYDGRPLWRNEEGGLLVDGDAAADAASHFDRIWEEADELGPDLLGVVMDFPSVRELRFVAVREVSVGQLVVASDAAETTVVGEIRELTAYNESFPQMTEEMFLSQGLGGAPPRRINVPDIPSLFSHPVKDHGFLVAKTFFRPESAFTIARVRVLRRVRGGRGGTATVPVPPGSDVRAPSAALLRRLLGDGDVRLGRLAGHAEVGVWLRSDEILSKHLAVLGMTGSGKSNAVKHVLRTLAARGGLRVFVVDTHGEYATAAATIDGGAVLLDVSIPDRIDMLDWEMVKERFAVERMTAAIKKELRAAAAQAHEPSAFAGLLAGSGNDVVQDIADAVAADPGGFCVGKEEPRVVHEGGDDEADLSAPGLYVLDLRQTETFVVRSRKCAVLAERVFREAKSGGLPPALLVVDEAHNYVPERTTGYMAEAARHGSLGALTTVAVEGRKFGVGLVIVSQRPSRIAKDVLAQMNSQLVFRLCNLEDIGYVRESFEAADETFVMELSHLDTGVCICAGTMIEMSVRCDVPLFAPRRSFDLGAAALPAAAVLEEAVAGALPAAALVEEGEELVVFSGPEAEVTLRAEGGGHALDVDCADEKLAERVRAAVEHALAPVQPLSKSASTGLPEDA
ncbi:protein of unknown function DUF87 [Gaiella occulta]|uniref:PLD phosphodiesterase domain-containing protein n=1 Tax=Gaiella occulta TaxID=1002870 RepID=A0A7M2YZQ6_9ACTN|nr:DUF87 domain-containing protein [Gaiella occulta]RDI75570.1 protein of unknown function DUF87 [Gaiella occulta]